MTTTEYITRQRKRANQYKNVLEFCPVSGKIRYKSRGIAKSAVKDFEHSGRYNAPRDAKLNTYYCDKCESFHVGHSRDLYVQKH